MMSSALEHRSESLPEQALRYLGLHPDNPATWVLAALAQRYGLDPLLNEVAVISTKQGLKPYVTRDGLLTVAHRSGVFDGMTTDELRRSSTDDGWTAYVSVYRKDMAHPFRYGAQCKDSEPQAQAGNGPEMALARAERRALKRAFNVPTTSVEWDDEPSEYGPHQSPAGEPPAEEAGTPSLPREVPAEPRVPMATTAQAGEIMRLLAELGLAGLPMREPRLAYLGEMLGREVETTTTVTEAEANVLIDTMRRDVAALKDSEPITTDEPPL